MKSLKFLFVVLFGAVVGFTSCENLGLSPEDENSAIFDLMFLATADSSSTGGGHHHKHGHKGTLTEVAVADLSAKITTYIATKYVGSSIKHAAKTDSGYFAVHVVLADSTHKGLLFDASGNFLRERSGKGNSGTKIDLATLPAAITTYITANYAGSTLKDARKSSEGKYAVLVTKADGTKVLLGFDAAGVFLNELTPKLKGGKGKGK